MTAPESITLAIPTRDRPRLVERFVVPGVTEAIARGYPVLVVDQSEGDETESLLAGVEGLRYLRSDPPLSRARNFAVAQTSTPFLAFTDDDVEFTADWLDALAAELAAAPGAGAVCGRAETPDGDLLPGRKAGVYRWPTSPFELGSGFNMAFRRAALEDVGPFDERLGAGAPFPAGEDTDMLYRLLRAGWSVVCSDRPRVVHHDERTGREAVRLHRGYGVGAGAQTAKHLAGGDRAAVAVAVYEVGRHFAWLARSLATRRLEPARLQATFVAGFASGFRAWRRAQRP